MCLAPLTLWKPYADMDGSKSSIVPCGKCHKCRRDRQNAWVFRLQNEEKNSTSSAFITLTYADPPLSFNGHETLEPLHLKQLWKKIRKNYHGIKLKYFAVGEYGTQWLRPHYHAIVYNLPTSLLRNSEKLTQLWTHGSVDIANAEAASMRYTIGYIMSDTWTPTQDDDDRQPQFQRQSKNLGINYLSPQMVNYHLNTQLPIITQSGGTILKMPRYYKEKIFSKNERKKMAAAYQEIHKLNLNEYLNYDYNKEVSEKRNSVRRHEKEQKQLKKSNL